MRIIVFIVTALLQLGAAAAGFLLLLLAMNGFSERQATPGIILYVALGLGSAFGLGAASARVAKRLVERRSLGGLAASAIAVISFWVLGALVLVASFVVAVVLAEVMRGMR